MSPFSKIRTWFASHLPYLFRSRWALAIALIYLLFGSFWILVSDSFVFSAEGISFEARASTLKGLLFVFLSAVLIFVLTSTLYARLILQMGRLQTAQKMARIGDWTYDGRSGRLIWSDEMYRIMEQDPQNGPVSVEDLLSRYLGAEDSRQLARAIERGISHGEPYDLELELMLPSGTQKMIRAVGIPHASDGGGYDLQGIVQDITDRVFLENELTRHRDQLRAVVESLPGVLFRYQRFPDGRDCIPFQSKGSEQIWGLTPDEVMADNQRVWEQVDKRDLPKLMESIEISRKELSAWNHIWRSHHPDGTVYWHEGFGIPEKQEDGSVLWNSIILNVTDRVVAETKLHEKEEYWEMLTRHASDGIAICNAEGELVFFNETMQEWQGELDPSLKPEQWAEAYGLYTLDGSRLLNSDEIELCRALQGETVTNFRHSVKIPGKPLRYVESSGGPLYDNAGHQIGAMVLVRDITDRYQREYEITNAVIEAAEQERERIAAELHDSVAQELSIVSLNLNNYQLENPPAAESIPLLKARAYLDRALEETRSISHRMVPGTVRDLGLAGAVRELVEDLNTSGSTEIAFTCNFNTRLDPSQELDLFRIIQEALQNVLRHAGALLAAVDIRRKGEELEVTISDNGRGFRGTQASSKKLGIGLRTMRNRTLKWGGDLKIQSDQGSTIVQAVIPIKEAP